MGRGRQGRKFVDVSRFKKIKKKGRWKGGE